MAGSLRCALAFEPPGAQCQDYSESGRCGATSVDTIVDAARKVRAPQYYAKSIYANRAAIRSGSLGTTMDRLPYVERIFTPPGASSLPV